MKDCSSTFIDARTAARRRGSLYPKIVLSGLFVYFSGCSAFAAMPAFAGMQGTVEDCAGIIQDFSRISERSIPPRVLRNAQGIAVIRVLKGAFFFSGRIGEGVVIARLPAGGWSGPSAIATGGGGFGFQFGGQVTEFIIILNTRAAVTAFARGGNVEIGGALSVAAGPLGRVAEAGVLPLAAVYTYSRSQGFFAGASLEGTIFIAQSGKNAKYYQQPVTPEEILTGRAAPPPGAGPLMAALDQY
jgi:lipid-binding SYLF domain-containing protein